MVSPLKAQVFARKLASHPDQSAARFVLDGLRSGFRLGFDHSRKLKSAKKNKPSANQHAEVIDQYLAMKCLWEGYWAPFRPHLYPTSM